MTHYIFNSKHFSTGVIQSIKYISAGHYGKLPIPTHHFLWNLHSYIHKKVNKYSKIKDIMKRLSLPILRVNLLKENERFDRTNSDSYHK